MQLFKVLLPILEVAKLSHATDIQTVCKDHHAPYSTHFFYYVSPVSSSSIGKTFQLKFMAVR